MPQTVPNLKPAGPATSSCREIPLEIVSPSRTPLTGVPLSTGVCIPRGQLFEPGGWLLEGLGGVQAPVDTDVLHRWSDGSIRWMLVRFVARKLQPGRTNCTLLSVPRQPNPAAGASEIATVDSNLRIQMHSRNARDLAAIELRPQLCGPRSEDLRLRIVRHEQTVQQNQFQQFVVQYGCNRHRFLTLQLVVDVWPTTGIIRIDARLRNSRRAVHAGGLWDLGDAGSFLFRGLHLHVAPTTPSNAPDGPSIRWKASSCGRVREQHNGQMIILQSGSGGAAFANGNHRDRSGRSTVADRGYEARSHHGVLRGHRCDPVVDLTCGRRSLTAAVPGFWQNFPSSVAVDPDGVNIGLFPVSNNEVFELQGGEQKTHTVWFRVQDGSRDAVGAREADPNSLSSMDWVFHPPRCVQPPGWYRNAAVFDWLPDPDLAESPADSRADRYSVWRQDATTGRQSVPNRRERADEFGWRHFGDVPADHEQQHFAGFNTVTSHYNNQFDLIYGGILNLVNTADPAWFEMFEPLARHVVDIDCYHTTEDRACFNGGLFWHTDHYVDAWTCTHRTYSQHNAGHGSYGGGPSNEHNYTTGLLHYYFLTGNADARDAVTRLADWVLAMDDGSTTVWGLLDDGPTGLASQTVLPDFHGPGRGAGNSINALVDAWVLTRKDSYLAKAETLIRRVVHPKLDCGQLDLDDAEGHWSYTVCLLAIGRYLSAKLEAEQLDESYAYARAALSHIGRWMAEHEQPALSHPERLEYPTVAWAAQEFRKANVLRIAACCEDDTTIELGLRRRADELSDAAWRDFQSFGSDNRNARCLAIVLTEGLRDVFHRRCRAEYFPPSACDQTDWGSWQMLVPQKTRVKAMLKDPVALLAAGPRLLNPARWFRALQALGRQLGR